MSLLELKDINLVYDGEVKVNVLKNINLQIEEGEFLGIMGMSCAGKSSLLYIMSGLEYPTSGKVILEGKEITSFSKDELADVRLKELGFIFQFYNLIPILTVEENVMLPLRLAHKKVKDYKEQIDQIIEEVGLSEKRDCMPSQLSGGQQQRVAIARALIQSPKIIFADEPTGNLDYKSSEEIIELLHHLCNQYKKTIIMVTHNQELCRYTSRIIRIKDGEIEI